MCKNPKINKLKQINSNIAFTSDWLTLFALQPRVYFCAHLHWTYFTRESITNLFSDKPPRTGVDVTLLGLPRGFRGVLSSLLSKLDLRGVILRINKKRKTYDKPAGSDTHVFPSKTVNKEAVPAFLMKINLGHSGLLGSQELIQN